MQASGSTASQWHHMSREAGVGDTRLALPLNTDGCPTFAPASRRHRRRGQRRHPRISQTVGRDPCLHSWAASRAVDPHGPAEMTHPARAASRVVGRFAAVVATRALGTPRRLARRTPTCPRFWDLCTRRRRPWPDAWLSAPSPDRVHLGLNHPTTISGAHCAGGRRVHGGPAVTRRVQEPVGSEG